MQPLQRPQLVGERYEMLEEIGRGGMGAVFRGRHVISGTEVALKVLTEELAGDERTVRRFLREARTAMGMSHPHMVSVTDAFISEDGRPVMVMELLSGEDMAQMLARVGRIDDGEVASILLPVLHALSQAHGLGVVHRDLKPDNIFLARQNGVVVPKVLDFGIAKIVNRAVDAQSMQLTGTGMLLGTPFYMSPEQISGAKDIDHRADIWSLGVILYEALSGVRPFRGDNFGQLFAAIFRGGTTPLEQLRPDLPAPVTRVVMRCLDSNRALRPQSCGELAAALPAGRTPSSASWSFPPPAPARESITGAHASPSGVRIKPDSFAATVAAVPVPSVISRGGRSAKRTVSLAALVLAGLLGVGVTGWKITRGAVRTTPNDSVRHAPTTDPALGTPGSPAQAPERAVPQVVTMTADQVAPSPDGGPETTLDAGPGTGSPTEIRAARPNSTPPRRPRHGAHQRPEPPPVTVQMTSNPTVQQPSSGLIDQL